MRRILAAVVMAAVSNLSHGSGNPGETRVAVTPSGALAEDYTRTAARIASQYVRLAGSEDNALALVIALREGTSVQLTMPESAATAGLPEITTIDPPTGRLEWSDVRFALVTAQGVLYRLGIRQPTGEQLQATLVGGELRIANGPVVEMRGILQMRAEGVGWREIASNARPKGG